MLGLADRIEADLLYRLDGDLDDRDAQRLRGLCLALGIAATFGALPVVDPGGAHNVRVLARNVSELKKIIPSYAYTGSEFETVLRRVSRLALGFEMMDEPMGSA
jgi:hypothetical protein